jgi:hypothetical protein
MTSKERLTRCYFGQETDRPGLYCRPYMPNQDPSYDALRAYLAEVYDLKGLFFASLDCDPDGYFEKCRAMGDRGIIEVYLGNNPAGTVAERLGSEAFALLTATDRDQVHELCAIEMDKALRILDRLIAAGVGPFFTLQGQEYIVPPLHGRRDFDDFNVRYDKPIADRIHNAGGRLHVHCHGHLKLVLDGFLELGADVLHPVEPPPMGNVTAAEARAILGDKVCIEGNIQISNMYERTPGQIREETEALIRDAYINNKGLIVSPTASPYIPGGGEVCLAQYKAMAETVLASKT